MAEQSYDARTSEEGLPTRRVPPLYPHFHTACGSTKSGGKGKEKGESTYGIAQLELAHLDIIWCHVVWEGGIYHLRVQRADRRDHAIYGREEEISAHRMQATRSLYWINGRYCIHACQSRLLKLQYDPDEACTVVV